MTMKTSRHVRMARARTSLLIVDLFMVIRLSLDGGGGGDSGAQCSLIDRLLEKYPRKKCIKVDHLNCPLGMGASQREYYTTLVTTRATNLNDRQFGQHGRMVIEDEECRMVIYSAERPSVPPARECLYALLGEFN